MSKILHIDTDLQIPNRLLKDDTNQVKQITDKAQNIAFSQSDEAKMPIYNYDGYYEFPNLGYIIGNKSLDLINDWTICFRIQYDNIVASDFTHIICCDAVNVADRGWAIYMIDRRIYIVDNQNNLTLILSLSTVPSQSLDWEQTAFITFKNGTLYSALYQHGTYNSVYYNRLVQGVTLNGLGGFLGKGYPLAINGTYDGQQIGGTGILDFISIYNYAIDDIITMQSPVIEGLLYNYTKPFNYYHRYKDDGNKKLYLSSKYLKDAVIDENSISTLNSSIIGEGAATRRTATGEEPLITDRGISFDGSQRFLYNQANAEDCFVVESLQSSPQARMTIGFWCKVDASGGAPITTAIKYTKDGQFVNDWLESRVGYPHADKLSFWQYGNANVNNVTTLDNIVYGVWAHYCLLFDTDTMYFFKDGVFQDSSPLVAIPTDVEENYLDVVIGGRWKSNTNNLVGLMDDVLISTSLLVNPLGYSVGQKVFEPPRRGGFDDNFETKPLISINSSLIKKDSVTNLVSTLYQEYTPAKNRFVNNNSNCVENGDGLDFANNVTTGNMNSVPFNDFTGEFFIGWWGKYKTNPLVDNKFTLGADASSSSRGFSVSISANSRLSFNLNGVNYGGETNVRVIVDFSEWNYFSLARTASNSIYLCKNGYISDIVENQSANLSCNGNQLMIGNTGGINQQPNDGKLDNIIMFPSSIYNFDNFTYAEKVFTPPKRSSDNE